MNDVKDKLRDKKFQKKFLICLAIFMIMVFSLNWLVKSQQESRQKNEVSNFSPYYKGLLAKCGQSDKAVYDCCFASVELMAANNYKSAPAIGCEPGYKINTYGCLGSYKWCEMPR